MKKFNHNRRDFLTKMSLALGGLGVSPLIKGEMIASLAKKILPEAQAADVANIDYVIEITLRRGYPFNSSMFPHSGFTNPNRSIHTNCYANANDIIGADCGNGNTLFLTPAAQRLQMYAPNIAVAGGLNLSSRGHTEDFEVRSPREGAVNPGILWSNTQAPPAVVQGGIGWGYSTAEGFVTNIPGTYQNVTPVQNANALRALFRAPTFSNVNQNEVSAITEAISKLNSGVIKQQLEQRLSRGSVSAGVKSGETASVLLSGGAGDFLTPTTALENEFAAYVRPARGRDNYNLRGPNFGEAMMYCLLGFNNNLFNYFHYTHDTRDWHPYSMTGANTGQEITGQYFSDRLATLIKKLQETPSLVQGQNMFDRTLIVVTTEFTRAALGVRTGANTDPRDNPDQGTNGFVLIGGKVNGGTYGGITNIQGNRGRDVVVQGFDPATGNLTPSNQGRIQPASAYTTVMDALGIGIQERMAQGVTAPVLRCLLRS